jgi:hypothetical protein
MVLIEFKNWLFESDDRLRKISLPQTRTDSDKNCKTSCARSSIVWLIKLKKNWRDYFSPEEAESILNKKFVRYFHDGDYVEGLQAGKNKFMYKSKIYNKIVDLIPEEEEVRGMESPGVAPIEGGTIYIRPLKPEDHKDKNSYGYYVGEEEKIKIPSESIQQIKAVGGCALTCLHMSGGQVTSKTVGGYKKTHLFLNKQNDFYNETLIEYFKQALRAVYKTCVTHDKRSDNKIDYYAIRLNGTTDILHYANKFTLNDKTIKSINKAINFLNNKNKDIKFSKIQYEDFDFTSTLNFFETFNFLWEKATQNVNCKSQPTFVSSNFVKFYDYTAIEALKDKYHRKELPQNYHITFSAKEGNFKSIIEALNQGIGVALPIWIGGIKKTDKVDFPSFWHPYGFNKGEAYRIIDGDKYDARFLDKGMHNIPEDEGYVIGLRAKGKLEDIQDYDSGFAEKILVTSRTPEFSELNNFALKYKNTIRLNDANFQNAKEDFMYLTNGYINNRFDPNDPAINRIIYEQMLYTLRRNNIVVNKLGNLKSKSYYDNQEAKGVEKLVNIKDLDYDDLHSTFAGRSAKTDKKIKSSMSGTSSKIEKNTAYKVSTNQTNMLPNTLFSALRNQLEKNRMDRLGKK